MIHKQAAIETARIVILALIGTVVSATLLNILGIKLFVSLVVFGSFVYLTRLVYLIKKNELERE